MIRARLSELVSVLGGELHGVDLAISGVGIDTRSLDPGALFVALPGTRTDGHHHLPAAQHAGAAAALVQRRIADCSLTQWQVADPAATLAALAGWWRARCAARAVALTGSNGKTTTKNLLAAILASAGPTLATAGNLNNELGVPLTLLALSPEHRYAVIEIGAGQPDDVEPLARLAAPAVGLITQIGSAHLERMGSTDVIARTKAGVYRALTADGVLAIPADDAYAVWFAQLAEGRRIIQFGAAPHLEVSGRLLEGDDPPVELKIAGTTMHTRLKLLGAHNLANALAAAACAHALGIDAQTIAAGLEQVWPVAGRLCPLPAVGGALLLDDSYNANPGSVRAGMAALKGLRLRRWAALGDMAELGPDAAALHAEVGQAARELGIERLLVTGALSVHTARGFGVRAEHHEQIDSLIDALRHELTPEVVLLVKGSRSAHMERVVAALRTDQGVGSC